MAKFKIGDTVRVLKDATVRGDLKGIVGTICHIHDKDLAYIDWEGYSKGHEGLYGKLAYSGWNLRFSNIELVKENSVENSDDIFPKITKAETFIIDVGDGLDFGLTREEAKLLYKKLGELLC